MGLITRNIVILEKSVLEAALPQHLVHIWIVCHKTTYRATPVERSCRYNAVQGPPNVVITENFVKFCEDLRVCRILPQSLPCLIVRILRDLSHSLTCLLMGRPHLRPPAILGLHCSKDHRIH